MADLERIGIQAVFENLGGYLTGAKKMEDANKSLEKAQVRLANVINTTSISGRKAQDKLVQSYDATAEAVRKGSDRIAEAREKITNVEDKFNKRITKSQENLRKLQDKINATAVTDTANRTKLLEKQSAAQIKHADLVAASQLAINKARKDALKVEESVANNLARSARTEIAARSAIADVAVLSAGRIRSAQLGVEAAGGTVARSLSVAGTALRGYTLATQAAHGVTRLLGSALIAVTGFANRFAVSLRFGVTALAAFVGAFTISQASQFESTLTRIDNLTEATTAETQNLGKALLDLSKTVPTSPNELGAAAYQILSSGISDVNEALKITEISAKGAAIGLGTTTDVARVVTSVINAYGKENINAAQTTDILARAIQQGSADATDFVSNIGRLLGIAPNLGIEFDQIAAAVASLTNVGLPANQAITALLGIMNQLISPSAQATEILKNAGTSIEELQENIDKKGLTNALRDLLTLFDGNVEVLEKLFPEVRGLTGALFLLRDGGADVDRILRNVSNSSGFVETAFEKANKTFDVQAKLLQNRLNRAFIILGSNVLPFINKAISDFTKFLDENKETIDSLLSILEEFAKGIATVVREFAKLTQAIVGNEVLIITAFVSIGTALALILGPIPVITAAIIALTGVVINNWDKIRNATIDAWGGMPKIIQDAIKFIATDVLTRVNAIIDIFELLFEGIKLRIRLFDRVLRGDWQGAWNAFKDIAKNAAELLVAVILAPFGSLANKMIALAEAGVNGVLAVIEDGAKRIADFKVFGKDVVPISAPDLGRVNLGRIDVAGLPEFQKSVEGVGDASKKATEESENYANNGLKPLEREYKRGEGAAEDAKAATDALSDGIIDFKEATELGIGAIAAGALEASRLQNEAAEKAFNFTKALSLVANAFQKGAAAAQKVVLNLAKTALQAAQAAGSALFSRPTREIAKLELALIKLQIANSGAISSLEKQLTDFDKRVAEQDAARQVQDLQKALREADTPEERQSAQEAINDFNRDRSNQRQRDAIQAQIDKLRESEEQIQKEIEFRNLQTEALQKQIVAADATLLSQGQLTTAALEVSRVVAEQSRIVKFLSDQLGLSLVPEVDAMREAANLSNKAFELLTNEQLRAQFIPAVSTAATKTMELAVATEDLTKTFVESMQAIRSSIVPTEIQQGRLPPLPNPFERFGFAEGGFVTRTTQATLHAPEVVLPLGDPARSRELIRAIPAALAAQIGFGSSSGSSLMGDVNVTGYIPAEMESLVVHSIRREMRRSNNSLRSVGLR